MGSYAGSRPRAGPAGLLPESGSIEFVIFEFEEPPPAPSAGLLTPTEQAIVGMLLSGLGAAEVSARRGVSYRTTANQLTSIYQKLGVSSREELVAKLAHCSRRD